MNVVIHLTTLQTFFIEDRLVNKTRQRQWGRILGDEIVVVSAPSEIKFRQLAKVERTDDSLCLAHVTAHGHRALLQVDVVRELTIEYPVKARLKQ